MNKNQVFFSSRNDYVVRNAFLSSWKPDKKTTSVVATMVMIVGCAMYDENPLLHIAQLQPLLMGVYD